MKTRAEDNLVSTWLIYELSDNPTRTMSDVVAEMNSALQRSYRLSRISEWERGSRHPDPIAHNYILRRTLPYAVESATRSSRSLSKSSIDRLLTRVSLPLPAVEA